MTRLLGLLVLVAVAGSPLAGLFGVSEVTGPLPDGRSKAPVDGSEPSGWVLVVLADGLSWRDLSNAPVPNLRALSRHGAIGLLNTNIPGRPGPGDGYPTLGAGTRTASAFGAGEAARATENLGSNRAGDLYQRRTGLAAPDSAIVHAGLGALDLANRGLDYPVELGALGESLKRAGISRAVFGNADRPGLPGRQVVSVIMDNLGQVPAGDVGATTVVADPAFPTGRRTDWDRLTSVVTDFLASASPGGKGVIAVETGDLSRIQAEKEKLIPERRRELYRVSLERIDSFLARLTPELDPGRDLLLLVSPTPDPDSWLARDSLTPVLAWGRGMAPGLVYSGTTRRTGVIANTDIAPTILAHYGLMAPGSFVGRQVRGKGISGEKWTSVDRLHERWLTVQVQRPTVVKGYVLLQILAVLASLGATLMGLRLPGRFWFFVLLLIALPLSMLTAAVFPPLGILVYVAVVAALGAGIARAALALGRGQWLPAAGWISLATAGALALDIALSGPGSTGSPLGYSPISGARYYGLGNEYMGVMVGALLVGLSILRDQWPHRGSLVSGLLAAVFTGALGLIGSPALGANFGGAITAAVGFSVAYLRLAGLRPAHKQIVGASLVLILTLSGIVAWDLRRAPGTESHVGQTFRLVWETRGDAVWGVVHRKLAMNMKLLRATIWSGALVTFLSTLVVLSHRPAGIFRRITLTNPSLAVGISATALASLVALAVNDSGVVAAATMLIYPTGPLMYLANTDRT